MGQTQANARGHSRLHQKLINEHILLRSASWSLLKNCGGSVWECGGRNGAARIPSMSAATCEAVSNKASAAAPPQNELLQLFQ